MELFKNISNNLWWTGKKVQHSMEETGRKVAIDARIKRTEAKLAFDRKFKK